MKDQDVDEAHGKSEGVYSKVRRLRKSARQQRINGFADSFRDRNSPSAPHCDVRTVYVAKGDEHRSHLVASASLARLLAVALIIAVRCRHLQFLH